MKNYNKLTVRWNKRERDFHISYPRRCDGHLASAVLFNKRMHPLFSQRKPGDPPWGFDPSFIEELESRGYDTKTLRFSVELRVKEPEKEKKVDEFNLRDYVGLE